MDSPGQLSFHFATNISLSRLELGLELCTASQLGIPESRDPRAQFLEYMKAKFVMNGADSVPVSTQTTGAVAAA